MINNTISDKELPIHGDGLYMRDWIYVYDHCIAIWQVRSFPEIKIFHHRRMGTEDKSIWRVRLLQGVRDYLIGYHPLYEIAKCLRRVVEKPYVIGSVLWLTGYFCAAVHRYERPLYADVVRYIRRDQVGLLQKKHSQFLEKQIAKTEIETE